MSGKNVERAKLLRLVDANLNRAAEAARVVEDCARFVLDHAGLAHAAKSLRHRLHLAAQDAGWKTGDLLSARDTVGDVGTELSAATERTRADLPALLRANFQRLEQSLRVLEEYAKLPGGADPAFERIRYDVYTLEKDFASPPERPARLDDKRLMVLVGGGTPEATVATAARVLEGGCRLIELREKT
ncbi:MAG TPA: thiamine phosphate synthase, partial [Planctomycetota bacterium]|nr:thiamine phosphate synthase [Planctomycetota bacterium]